MDYQGGGGFGADNVGVSSQQTPNSGGRARRSYDDQSCIPVTISMAMNAKPDETDGGEGKLQLEDGRKIAHVRLVVATRSVEEFSTNIVYSVEDGTGLIEVKQWMDENNCSAVAEMRQKTLRDHTYLKVVGQVKDYDGKKMILADAVRPLSTGNELTHHFLEVVHSAEYAKRKNSYVPGGGAAMMGMSAGVGFGGAPSGLGRGVPLAQQGNGNSGNEIRDTLMNFIKVEGDRFGDHGVNVQSCIQNLVASGHAEQNIRTVLQNLSDEGLVYSTINEDNFKCT